MGTIIEFPADAASRRLGSTMDGAPREGMGTVLILPVVRIEREPDETSGGSGPEEGTAPGPPPPPAHLTSDILDMPETCFPIRTGSQAPVSTPLLTLLLLGLALGGCSGGDFGRTRQDFLNDDMHRWIGGEATGSVGLRPSQFQLTDNERQLRDLAYPLIEPPHSRPAWKSVFGDYKPLPSPWRQSAGVRSHRLWAPVDRRAAPLAFLALCAADRRRARRHHPVRAVLRHRRARARSRQEAQRQPEAWFRNCRRASAPTRSPAWKRTP